MKKDSTKGFTLVELLVVIGILGILMASLFPAISSAMLNAKTTAMASNGRKIHQAITLANTSREMAGKGTTVWPRKGGDEGGGTQDDNDIGTMTFNSSTEWFKKLFDIENKGNPDNYRPEVEDLDVNVLSGAGVPPAQGTKLEDRNVAWTAVANVKDSWPDVMPVLLTRNVHHSDITLTSYNGTDTTPVKLGGSDWKWTDPFQNKAWVVVRKGGGTEVIKARYSTLDVVFKNSKIEIQQTPAPEFLEP